MILLDTHVVVWLSFAPERVSRIAKTSIADARKSGEGLAVSCISLIELATLARKGRVEFDTGAEAFLQEVEDRFLVVPINARVCARSLELPRGYPNDPADRIIGATALVHGVALVTADKEIRKSKALTTIW